MWFAKMANNKKAVYGTDAGGWFWNKGEKRDHPPLHTFEAYQIMTTRKNTFLR